MLAIKYLYFAYKAQSYVLLPHTRENLVKGASVPFSNHLWLQSLLSLGPHYEAVIKCLRHLLRCTFIFKIQFTQVFCTKQKVIKIQCFLLHKEHEIISILSILILLFPSCHSFLLEKTKQSTVVQCPKSMDNLNRQSTFNKLYTSKYFFMKDK